MNLRFVFISALLPSLLFTPFAKAESPRSSARAPKAAAAPANAQTKLICKTGSDKRAPGQPLKLFFQYDMPFQFEPEDPTVPYGRQTFVLAGRPMVQMSFEKAAGPAGERGEELGPMQCAFAKRALNPHEPSQVSILIQPGEIAWFSQTLGQKPGNGSERTLLSPAGADWAFAYRYDQVFTLDLDDSKDFVTAQKPHAL